jgi:adenylyltransferase/sulfurtransferase
MNESAYPAEISVGEAAALLARNDDRTILIDVREPHELEICRVAAARHIPMRQIPEQLSALPRDRHLLIMCHHGGRSLRVTEFLRDQGFSTVSNVTGGIDAWAREIEPALARY